MVIYKPSQIKFEKGDTIDAQKDNTLNVQANVRGSVIYGYKLTIEDMKGIVVYKDVEMVELDTPVPDGEIIRIVIPSGTLSNTKTYQLTVRYYDTPKGSGDPQATQITKSRLKGSDHSILWVKISKDVELETKIYGVINEFKYRDTENKSLSYKKEIATIIVNGNLDGESEQIKTSCIDLLANIYNTTSIEAKVDSILEFKKQETLDKLKYDNYIQVDSTLEKYGKDFIITPHEKEKDKLELPKTSTYSERRKITWTEAQGDWLYLELDISGTNEETKGLTYMPTDGSTFDTYEVSGLNTISSFFVDKAICENTADIGNYVLFYDSPESALKAHIAGDLPGGVYTVQPIYQDALKIIAADVTTGEIRVDGQFDNIPKKGYVPRFFVYDTLTETYEEKKIGKEKIRYKVPTNSDYYDLEGTLDGENYNYYCYWDPTDSAPDTSDIMGVFHPAKDPEDIDYQLLASTCYGPEKKTRHGSGNACYYLDYSTESTLKSVMYSAPSPFKVGKAQVESGYHSGFSNMPTKYMLEYSIDGINFTATGLYGSKLCSWNADTGMPYAYDGYESIPAIGYTYKHGDAYYVRTVNTNNYYKPTGSTYTGEASTTHAEKVEVGNIWCFNKLGDEEGEWVLLRNSVEAVLQPDGLYKVWFRGTGNWKGQTSWKRMLGTKDFLNGWNADTGMPVNPPPPEIGYTYKTGDYYIVEVSNTSNHYIPDGTSYTGIPSTKSATSTRVGSIWYFNSDGQWMPASSVHYNFLEVFSDNTDITVSGPLDALWEYKQLTDNPPPDPDHPGGIYHKYVDNYGDRLFYMQNRIVDVSGVVLPKYTKTPKTGEVQKNIGNVYYKSGSIQKYSETIKVFLDPREALAALPGATSIGIRHMDITGGTTYTEPYTETAYSDGYEGAKAKIDALSSTNLALVIGSNKKLYIDKNLYDMKLDGITNYVLRVFNWPTQDTVFSQLWDGIQQIRYDIVPTFELSTNELTTINTNSSPRDMYYDMNCKHRKGTLAYDSAVIINNKVAELDGYEADGYYFMEVPQEFDVYAFTPYYKDEACTEYLGETPRYYNARGSRISTYVGKITLKDNTTAYIKLPARFKIPEGSKIYEDQNLTKFSYNYRYNNGFSRALGSKFVTQTVSLNSLGYLAAVRDDENCLIAINATGVYKKEPIYNATWNKQTDKYFSQLRYACNRCIALEALTGKVYTSRNAIEWEQILTSVEDATYIYTSEDTLIVLTPTKYYVSYDCVNFDSYDLAATSVASAFGMYHFLSNDKIYSTTNFKDYLEKNATGALSLGSNLYSLYVMYAYGAERYKQEGRDEIRFTNALTNPAISVLANGFVGIYGTNTRYVSNICDYGNYTPTEGTGYYIYSTPNFDTFVNLTSEETINAITVNKGRGNDVYSHAAVEADVVDWRTLRIGNTYINNSLTMMLKGGTVCKDGYIAGLDTYTIKNEKLSIFEGDYGKGGIRSVFLPTPQRNRITSGNIYSDIERTDNIGTITATDGYEYQFIDMTVSALYNGTDMIGYCDTPISNYMIEGTKLYSDMDFVNCVGEYVPEYNVPCFVDIKEITDIVPLTDTSTRSSLPFIEYRNGIFGMSFTEIGSRVDMDAICVPIRLGLASSRLDYYGGLDYFSPVIINNDTNNSIIKYIEPLGNWCILVDGNIVENPTYSFKVVEIVDNGDGTYNYIYHEVEQPTKCGAVNLANGRYIYSLSQDLNTVRDIKKIYNTNKMPIMQEVNSTDGYNFALINGTYRRAEVSMKNSHSGYYDYASGTPRRWYYLDTNKWSFYNEYWASISTGKFNIYFALPSAGKTTEDKCVHDIEYDFEGNPSKGYIDVDGKLYRVKASSIIEDTTLTSIDETNYREQIVGGNPIIEKSRVESNNDDRLFITANVNVKEDASNPMSIIFNNGTTFTVNKLEEVGTTAYIIENKGGVPIDENQNLYPTCDYEINTSFIDSDPAYRFSCKSTPDLNLEKMDGVGINYKCKARIDPTQNWEDLEYEWSIYIYNPELPYPYLGERVYHEYGGNELHVNSLIPGPYIVVCKTQGVTTLGEIELPALTQRESGVVINEDNCISYIITGDENYPHLYKYKVGEVEMEYMGDHPKADVIDYDIAFDTQYCYVFLNDNNEGLYYIPEPIHHFAFVIMDSSDNIFEFDSGYTAGSVTLNIDHTLTDSLSKYGKVTVKEKEYHSGSFSGLIGYIEDGKYYEHYELEFGLLLRDWKKFISKNNTLLYRTPNGDKYYIKITESPTYTVNDTSPLRQTTVDFNWSEVEREEEYWKEV